MLVDLPDAVKRLKNHEVVAIATDTLYGLCSLLESDVAIEKIYQLKKRPKTKPLLVLASSIEQVKQLTQKLPESLFKQLEAIWPASITVILPARTDDIARKVYSSNRSIAIRIPKHPELLNLLEQTGPIVAPSANLSGESPYTTPENLEKGFTHQLPILAFEGFPKGTASTIIKYDNESYSLIREGAIEWSRIKNLLNIDLKNIDLG